ncbi:hypothetical protein [Trueperella pyogenes]|uniref:hypothetical protein n=1 Tax=Trueperella pyogenes TaxID=1661 RepID=UPI0024BFC7A8|nr:hypothetical protein [Trueperella pyogenes]WHU57065.1 hypothetical protein QEV10_10095 [Trueperella pyogenes]
MKITITIETSDDETTTAETGPQGTDALRRASKKRKEAHSKGQRVERLAQAGVPYVYIYKTDSGWVITIKYGACSYVTFEQPTHAEAVAWAENKLKELHRDRPHR